MRIIKSLFKKGYFLTPLFIAGLVILTFVSYHTYLQIQTLLKGNQWVIHTHTVIGTANELLLNLSKVDELETMGLLSNEAPNHSLFNQYANEIERQTNSLIALVKDNPVQLATATMLDQLINAKMDAAFLILNYIGKDNAKARELAIANQYRVNNNNISLKMNQLVDSEYTLLSQRNSNLAKDTRAATMALVWGGITVEILFIAIFLLLNYFLTLSRKSENNLLKAKNSIVEINKKLKMSEERFELATEGSNSGLWDWTPNTNNVYYSDTVRRLLGYSEQDFPNDLSAFNSVLHPDDYDQYWRSVQQHLDKRIPFNAEFRLRLKTGEYHWFQAAGQAFWNEAGEATRMSGSLIDITSKKKAEQRLMVQFNVANILSSANDFYTASQEILHSICSLMPWEIGTLWLVDKEEKEMRCFSYWQQPTVKSTVFQEVVNRTTFKLNEGLPGMVWKTHQPLWILDISHYAGFIRSKVAQLSDLHTALVCPISSENQILGALELFSTRTIMKDELLVQSLNATASQIGLFVRRKNVEKALKESDEYNAAIFESANDGIIILDKSCNIETVNAKMSQLFGWRQDELVNQDVKLLLPSFQKSMLAKSRKNAYEVIGLTKSQINIPLEISISQMALSTSAKYVLIVRDASERKKIEKLKGEFISIVSHELRTPLTSIRGSLSLLLSGKIAQFNEKSKNLLEIANNNSERLLLLINDILDIEKIEAGKMSFDIKRIDLGALVKESLQINKGYADKYVVGLRLDGDVKDVFVYADSTRLMQVLSNLLSNAIKFSSKGSLVTIKLLRLDNIARVAVHNLGSEIPKEFRNSMFQKFSQADSTTTREKSGTGLGLNISKAIIERLGGSIGFESNSGEGTTFYFDLPLEKPKIVQTTEVESRATIMTKILLCESNTSKAERIRSILESGGLVVDLCETIESAQRLLDEETYQALLLDLGASDTDAIRLIHNLRQQERTKFLPIIVLSMTEEDKQMLQGDVISIVDWLDDPNDLEEILHSISFIRKHTFPHMPSILHVEDDNDTKTLVNALVENEANVVCADNLANAFEKINEAKYDLVILDLLLPDGNGTELLPLLAAKKIPVLVYSALELDKPYTNFVSKAFVKSKISNADLLTSISTLLHLQKEVVK